LSLIKTVYHRYKRYPAIAALARSYGRAKHYGRMLSWLRMLRRSRHGWTIRMDGALIALENIDDFYMAFDLRSGRYYDRLLNTAPPNSVVWDIGANIGTASLIFAQNPNIAHIYAYEPMPHTFSCAQRSLALNPSLTPKIHLFNEGIGGSDRDLRLTYTRRAKSAIGVADIPERMKLQYALKSEEMEEISIHVLDADAVLRDIRRRHPDCPVLLKLDAEGIEYEVIDRLVETGSIDEIHSAAIEWHGPAGETRLLPQLQRSHFQTQAKVLTDDPIGMIDAWR
jgi:FkbM family methyltransferase